MAYRQQLLFGRHLSPVQHHASIIMGWIEARDQSQEAFDRVKLALLSSGQSQVWVPEKLFPQYLSAPEEEVLADNAELPTDGQAVNYEGVEWKSPSEVAEDEFGDLMAQIAAMSSGSISGNEMGGWV